MKQSGHPQITKVEKKTEAETRERREEEGKGIAMLP
jgi:hypothetical protein